MTLPVVLGPTASGKSALAIEIALTVSGEIVNCDSLQIYRGFNLGTAKIPEAERRGVRHHLIDVADPREVFTAGDYARVGRQVLHEIAGRGRVPIVVGGTGFYLRALLEGLFPGPERDDAIRARLEGRERRRPGSLHRILSRLDPTAAARIHSHDTNKVTRALEVRMIEGRPLSEAFQRGRQTLAGFHPFKMGLHPGRAELYQRIDARTVRIFEQGLLDEVRALLESGIPRGAKPFESLGYRQALAVLEGCLTPSEALASTQLETRRYAKRQITWFRKEHGVHWLDGFGDEPAVQQKALELLGLEIRN